MSNTKHTPGPWRADVQDPAFVNYDVRTDETIICTMGIDMCTEEEAANARLIAAAPELLEALMRLDAYHSLMVSSVDRQAIMDAIAKATQP
jgi:hypothetical protein